MKAEIRKYQRSLEKEQGKTDARDREALILKYAPLVKSIAERMAVRLPPHISAEELTSAGIVGLLDALDKFDPELGIKFKTYAEHRIRGSMLDELRKMDWVPRSIRKDIHRIEDAITATQIRLGRGPEDFEIAEELGLDIESYYKLTRRAHGVGLLSLDTLLLDGAGPGLVRRASDGPSPFDELQLKEIKRIVAEALVTLPEKEQLVMSLYYYDELTLKEIAKVLDLTESRISQIHSKVIITLRARLRSYFES